MKVRTSSTNNQYITPNKVYEVYNIRNNNAPTIGYITDNDGVKLDITIGTCIQLRGDKWEIIPEQDFANDVEVFNHILAGGCIDVADSSGYYMLLDNNVGYLDKVDNTFSHYASLFSKAEDYRKYTPAVKKEWYEEIPEQGVLCWVWSNSTKYLQVIYYYKEDDNRCKYKGKGTSWINAIPVTDEELESFKRGF